MAPVGVQQGITEKPVPFLVFPDVPRIEFQLLKELPVLPCHVADNRCDDDDNDGHGSYCFV
jgi:hypothetical protein